MACYHPLQALDVGMTANGKKDIKFLSYKPSENEHFVTYDGKFYHRSRLMQLPCGQCVGCRLEYSRQWANRCMLELEYHDSAYFVTLTYDDFHVPINYYCSNDETGEASPSLTLCKRDFQLFMKRLRKRFSNDKIRFFMAGEYGSSTFRPHYHAILYGLHLDDLTVYKRSPQGHTYYNSDSLASCWRDSNGDAIGFVVVAPVTWETCAYTARYVMKKLKGSEAKFYSDFNIQPEFTLMSRKPGIARQWYEDHPDLYDYDYINISTPKGGRKFRPPKYFDKLYDVEHPDEMAEIKELRQKFAAEAMKAKLSNTSLSPDELLEVEEATKVAQIKSLRRTIV